jgi:hypothetical protein
LPERAEFLRKLAGEAMTEAKVSDLAANWNALADEVEGKGTEEGLRKDASPQPG